jgi:hypothetical protein
MPLFTNKVHYLLINILIEYWGYKNVRIPTLILFYIRFNFITNTIIINNNR